MVDALSANRTDQPLDISISPRRASRDWAITNAHCAPIIGQRKLLAARPQRHCQLALRNIPYGQKIQTVENQFEILGCRLVL
jgi:hypothetical protein